MDTWCLLFVANSLRMDLWSIAATPEMELQERGEERGGREASRELWAVLFHRTSDDTNDHHGGTGAAVP